MMQHDASREVTHVLAERAATVQQPAPQGTGPAITPLVIADLLARSADGERKYGEPLRASNGRDVLADAYQEALDLCQYLRQAIEERSEAPAIDPEHYRLLYSIAVSLLDGLAKMPTNSIALPEGTAEVFDEWVRTYAVDDPSLEPIFLAATTASTKRPYRDRPQITRLRSKP